ncbi:MAG: peptidoglycan-binding domain-containing protein [Solirubrobacterales bacterium]
MSFGSTPTPSSRLALLATLVCLAVIAHPPTPAGATTGGAGQPRESSAEAAPFARPGMWIWYVSRSEGGNLPRIIARARRSGIGTVYVKAGDGSGIWGQFSTGLVRTLHRGGLDVCAWQFVYGDSPTAEARVGAAAVARGADCLVIDAESQYEGKYAAAETYIRALRARIGSSFPLSLAGFPYVDYHPAFPYSVFFGPDGATYNQPQMYWKAIGTSVGAVFAHTYTYNRLWGHPIDPLGQTYESPGRGEIMRFRSLAQSYGGAPSWWDWQETSSRGWAALGPDPAGPVSGFRPVDSQPVLRRGDRGDLVVWAQEHLRSAVAPGLAVSGIFGGSTYRAVRTFQSAHGLGASGDIDRSTWNALLNFSPAQMHWAGRASTSSARGATVSRATAIEPSRPRSASLPARAYEIPAAPRP